MDAYDYKEGLPVNIRYQFKFDDDSVGLETLTIFEDWSSYQTAASYENCSSHRFLLSIEQFKHLWDVCMVHVQYNLDYEQVYTKKSSCNPHDWKALMDYLVHDFDESCKRTTTRKGEERDVDVFTAEFFDGTAEAELSEEGWTVTYTYEEL